MKSMYLYVGVWRKLHPFIFVRENISKYYAICIDILRNM